MIDRRLIFRLKKDRISCDVCASLVQHRRHTRVLSATPSQRVRIDPTFRIMGINAIRCDQELLAKSR